MSWKLSSLLPVLGSILAAAAAIPAAARTAGFEADAKPGVGATTRRFVAALDPIEEVPAVFSTARGRLILEVDPGEQELRYELSYEAMEGAVVQAQLQFGQPGVNGGVLAWLCGTPDVPGPAGTPPCPASGTVSGTVVAQQVVGPASQGIGPGALAGLVDALRDGLVYANVRSDRFPGGEARGQIGTGPSRAR